MVSFGGAAGQHCCAVAEILGIETILIHPHCSVLSALGVKLSDHSISQSKTILEPLNAESIETLSRWYEQKTVELVSVFRESGITEQTADDLAIELRYEGTQSGLFIRELDELSVAACRAAFEEIHLRQFGYIQSQRPLELFSARATVTRPGIRLPVLEPCKAQRTATPVREKSIHSTVERTEKDSTDYDHFHWSALQAGYVVVGPAMVSSDTTTVIIDRGWNGLMQNNRLLQLTQSKEQVDFKSSHGPSLVDPVKLEIFNRSFQSIATQMGEALRKTSISVNVKERLDFSCALFCNHGRLVANAPHIPVHLGAMSDAVQATIRNNQDIRNGDVFVTNDPYAGRFTFT